MRDAFLAAGVFAVSCDLRPTASPGPHLQMDLFDALEIEDWKALIVFPPCTHLAISGARWFAGKEKEIDDALVFVQRIKDWPIKKKVIENPISTITRVLGPPTQIIHPWMFGHREKKETWLWIEGLPLLIPQTTAYYGQLANRIHMMPGGKDQADKRAETFPGIANAFAQQWSPFLCD